MLDELELIDELELLLEELAQLLAELDELELSSMMIPKSLELLLELELLEQLTEGSCGMNGVVRSAPQPCNNTMAQRQKNAEISERHWRDIKLIIRV